MTSSTRIWSNITTRGPIRHLKMAKTCRKLLTLAHFCDFKAPYRLLSGRMTPYSCRGGPKLRFAWSYIKIGQVLSSEMRKKWSKWQLLISPKRDMISKFQVHIWNQQQILHLIDVTHLRECRGPSEKNCIFQHICDTLKSTRDSPIRPRISP